MGLLLAALSRRPRLQVVVLVAAGRPIELQPFELSQLAYSGVWDQGPLLQAIESRRYPVILIYTNDETPPIDDYRWTPEMRAAIDRSYAVTESIPRQNGRTLAHRPR